MKNSKFVSHEKLEFLPAILVSIALFFYLTGGKILDVKYYQWLSGADPSQFLIGWMFFKNNNFWQEILGFNPDFAYEIVNSVVYTDSIPLLAIFFKIFAKILPQNFQYFGWWILLCFVLQAIFATILLKKITKNFALHFVGSLFFIFSPIFLFRIFYCCHFSLGAHFLILASLLLYFRKNFSQSLWFLLFLTSLGIHFYIFVMIFFVYSADLAQRALAIKAKISLQNILIAERILPALAFIVLIMWQYGYFVVGVQNVSATLFGETKMNLLSIVDSDGIWSKIIPNQQQGSLEYEGFAFLGLGVILMLTAIFFAEIFCRKNLYSFNNKFREKKFFPLIIIAIFLTLLALSNRISLGSKELFNLELYDVLNAFLGIIRSSGRMFWVAYYLILFSAIYAIISLCKNKMSTNKTALMLAVFFIVQFVDMSNALRQIKFEMKIRYENKDSFVLHQSDFWENVKNKYQKIIFLPVSGNPRKYNSIAYFAAINHLKINSGYVARYSNFSAKAANKEHIIEILDGNFNENAIYVFSDQALWIVAQQSTSKSDFIGEVDGYKIIAPKYYDTEKKS